MIDDLLSYSVGIDISKSDFKVCFSSYDTEQVFKVKSSGAFANSSKGYTNLIDWLYKLHKQDDVPLFIVMEATGVYHEQLAWYLYNKGFNVSVVLATRAKRYLQSIGQKSKNDKIDAQGLCRMCAEQRLPLWQPISKNIYRLRSYTRLHESLQKQITSLRNQLHSNEFGMYELKEANDSLRNIVEGIKKELKALEKNMGKLIEEDLILKEKYDQISVIKGISLLSFAVLVGETDGFALFKNQAQLVSYAGYDVIENQSGNHRGKTKISKKGNTHIRRVLHMPSLVAIRHEPRFTSFYERLYERSGYKMKAIVAVQKKMLCLVYALWKKGQAYNPDYINEHSKAKTVDSLSVDCNAITKKEARHKSMASQDEHSSALAVSPLSVLQI